MPGGYTAQDLYKTKICEFYKDGRCPRENDCTFAHGAEELRRLPSQRGRGYDNWRGAPPHHVDRRGPRHEYSPRVRSRTPPNYRGETNGRWAPRAPIAERLGDRRPLRRSETPGSPSSSREPSPKRPRVEASPELRRRSSSNEGRGREQGSERDEEEDENERERSASPQRSRSQSPLNDARHAQLARRLAEERAANEELEAKLVAYEDMRAEFSQLQAENERLAKINMAQKEKLEIMQDLVDNKNRDIVERDIKLAKLQKRSKAAEDNAWAAVQLKKLAKVDQQRRSSEQQYRHLLDEASDVLRDYPAPVDDGLDAFPTPRAEALRLEGRQKADHGPTANGNLEGRLGRAAIEHVPGESPIKNVEPLHHERRSPDAVVLRERPQEGDGPGRLWRVGARQYGAQGKGDNWDGAKGDEGGASKEEAGPAKYPVEGERLARKAQTAAQSEVGGGFFKAPANVVRNVKRFEDGRVAGAAVVGRAAANERAPLEERANGVNGVIRSPPREAGEYTETAKEEFRNMAYPMPIVKDTVLQARYEETSEAVNIG